MAKLIIKAPESAVAAIELPLGTHRLGRSLNTDCQIAHPSVSGSHCELIIDENGASVRDLGSTNGTWMNGQRIEEASLASGQSVRLGEVEIVFEGDPQPGEGLRLEPMTVQSPPALPRPPEARLIPPSRPKRETNFYKTIPGAFVYPFRKHGLVILIGGTIVFGILDAAVNFRIMVMLVIGLFLGFFMTTFLIGYVFVYMQSIITTTALGESHMPDWPPYEGWWDSAVAPFLRWATIIFCCAAPATYFAEHYGEDYWAITLLLMVAGICYYPMALLAVAMNDTIVAINPLLVGATIVRVPLEYMVTCVLFGFLTGIVIFAPHWFSVLRLPLIGTILSEFLFLYFSTVEMRLAGLLYYTRRARFGWKY